MRTSVAIPMNILMVGHSYVVDLNRRVCRELALAGGDRLRVTVAAPSTFPGDLRPIRLEQREGEPYALEPVATRLSKSPHLFTYARKLGGLLGGRPWDVVHAWEEPYILAGGQLAALAPRSAALVYSSFQNLPKTYPPPFNLVERYCLRRAAGWTAFGQTIAENLRDRPGYRDRPFATIPVGVDLDVFRPDATAGRRVRQDLGWTEPGPPVVGFLGRFVPQKGIALLLRALDRLDPGTWRALWVGGGPLEPTLREWAARQGDRVRVVTGVTHDAVPDYLNAMDLLAAPSQTTPRWKEQFGRMLLEAMGVGATIVASDSGEIPHVVGDAGVIVPEADESAWVEVLRHLLDSPALRSELRERALARVHALYAWPIIARQYLDFFRQLRDAKPAAPVARPKRLGPLPGEAGARGSRP